MSTTILQALAALATSSTIMSWWDPDEYRKWAITSTTFAVAFVFAAILLPLDV